MKWIKQRQKEGLQPNWKIFHLRKSGRETSYYIRQDFIDYVREQNLARFEKRQPCARKSDNVFVRLDYLYPFAKWAFGQSGLPNLEILAFGDFSHNNRYRKRNILLAPLPGNRGGPHQGRFRVIKLDAVDQWTSVSKVVEFLEACPNDRLLRDGADGHRNYRFYRPS